MQAITISQPFASLIASGAKWVENRTWPTSYRGPLAIHAGQGTQYLTAEQLRQYPTGCIVATCELVSCVDVTRLQREEPLDARTLTELHAAGVAAGRLLEHEHCEGPWAWVLTEVRRYAEPVPCRGAQKLWTVPEQVLREFVDQMAY